MAFAQDHHQVVLIVEDQAIIRMELVDTFQDEGFEVLEAGAAAEALTLLAGRPDIAVLFTDVDMPGKLNGFTLARVARKMRPELVILVASGHMTPEARDLPTGAKFLPKPYTPNEAISAVNALVEATD